MSRITAQTRRVFLTRMAGGAVLCTLAPTVLRGATPPDPDFHLYLLMGQSNMAGRGTVDEESTVVAPNVLMFNKAKEWVPAVDPLHFDKAAAGVGPGLAFGKAMATARPKARIGLIPCAVGGTGIGRWVPGAEDKATNTHPYDDMLVRAKAALESGVLKGILWHQGEADRKGGKTYGPRLIALIQQVRGDLGAPTVPFVAGEITSFVPEGEAATEEFNTVLRGLTVPHYGWVTSQGLAHRGDKLHYDSPSARTLGRRYAEKMLALQGKDG